MGAILSSLVIPRGRASRADLLAAALLMLTVEVVLFSFEASIAQFVGAIGLTVIKAFVFWVGCVAVIRRLHDLGYSAWWVVAGAAFICMWVTLIMLSGFFIIGRDVLVQGSYAHLVLLALAMIPPLSATLWLHLAPGEPFRNRFGQMTVDQKTVQGDRSQAMPQSSVSAAE